MKNKWIKVRCTEEQRERAYRKAEEYGMNFSEYIWFLLSTSSDLEKWHKFHTAVEQPINALADAYKNYIESMEAKNENKR